MVHGNANMTTSILSCIITHSVISRKEIDKEKRRTGRVSLSTQEMEKEHSLFVLNKYVYFNCYCCVLRGMYLKGTAKSFLLLKDECLTLNIDTVMAISIFQKRNFWASFWYDSLVFVSDLFLSPVSNS